MELSDRDCREIRGALDGRTTNFRYRDIARWLSKADFVPPSNPRGSHRWWRHPSGRRVGVPDHGRGQVKWWYVKEVAKVIVELGGCPK